MMLTDIEGSTGLIERLGDGYGSVLDEVRSIQRAATAAAGGYVVEERADEFFGVFASPRAALEAAIAIHRGMCARGRGARAPRCECGSACTPATRP